MNPRRFSGLFAVIGILIIFLSAPAGVCGEVDRYTLPNGMVVILAPDHSTPAVSMNIWINVGACQRAGFGIGDVPFHRAPPL